GFLEDLERHGRAGLAVARPVDHADRSPADLSLELVRTDRPPVRPGRAPLRLLHAPYHEHLLALPADELRPLGVSLDQVVGIAAGAGEEEAVHPQHPPGLG